MDNITDYFDKYPEALELSEEVTKKICNTFDNVNIKISKTQISFSNKYGFAYISVPLRRMKNTPEVYIIVTFGLGHKENDQRIIEAVEPYPGRWTHHVIIQNKEEIDLQLMKWLEEAYNFSLNK